MSKYASPIQLACYDEVVEEVKEEVKEEAKEEVKEKVFRTQAEVNAYLAEDRRKTEAKFKAQQKAELQKQEKMYNDLLSSKSLTEQERDAVRESLSAVESQLHTEKERLLKEKKVIEDTYTVKLTASEQRAKEWETRYKEASIKRELQEAAVSNDAFNARQMVDLLRPKTELIEVTVDGKPTGEYQVVVEMEVEGKSVKLPPAEAVKKMKEDASYSNLFKANVVSGLGKDTSASGTTGKVDLKHLSQAEYRKLRKENPALLGL
jgi:vacuolar-type H+-ATPase subunit I/STV1